MTADQVINVLVTITLIEMMVAIGLGVRFAELRAGAGDWQLLSRAALANYVCVPAGTVGLLLLFDPHPMVAAGFLILAICPGAPYGPPLTSLAKGNVTVAIGLMAILASSAILAPILLRYLLPLALAHEPVTINAGKIVGTLLVTQLAPLCVGVALREWRPHWADRMQGPANLVSKTLNLVVVGVIVGAQFSLLMDIRLRGFVGMLSLLIASWAAGWLLGGPDPAVRKAMTLTTSLRNVGVGLVIASTAFPGTPAVTAALAYGLFTVVGSSFLALAWGRREAEISLPHIQENAPSAEPLVE